MAEIFILGAGTVGRATGTVLESIHLRPTYIDLNPAIVDQLKGAGHSATTNFLPSEDDVVVFVCLPTPAKIGKGYDLVAFIDAISGVIRACSEVKLSRLILAIRSTVPPGTCNNLITPAVIEANTSSGDVAVVAFPEFLREAHAIDDALNPRASVIGSKTRPAVELLARMLSPVSSNILKFDDPTLAEMVKVAHNAFNATKISFWNEMYKIGSVYDLDMNSVSEAVAATSEASWNTHYGIRGGRPFSGSCLPKDIIGLMAHAKSLGLKPHLLDAVHEVNTDLFSLAISAKIRED